MKMKRILSFLLALICAFSLCVGMSACAPTGDPDTSVTEAELAAAKTAAKTALSAYADPENYREAERTQLASAVADGNAAIDAATTKDDIAAALAGAKVLIDAIKTNAPLTAEELTAAKTAAKTALEGYKNAADYRDAEKAELSALIAEGKRAIDDAADIAAVSAALADAKAKIDAVKTDATLTVEELATAKDAAKRELDAYVNAENYRDAEKAALATSIENGKTAVDAAEDIAAVNATLADAKAAIDEIKTDAELTTEELAAAKTNAKNALSSYADADDYRDAEKAELAAAIAEGNRKIDAAENVSDVNTALANAKAAIDGIKTGAELTAEELAKAKDAAKRELDAYVNANDYRDAEKAELATAIKNGKSAIDAATDIAGVNAALASAKTKIDTLETDAEISAKEPTIRSSVEDGAEYTSGRMTADVWAKSAAGDKLADSKVTVTVNGEAASVNWSDSEKTSYNLVFEEGENIVEITATDGKYTKTVTYTVTYDPTKPTVITVCVEGFTLGIGYIVEPYKLVLDDMVLSEMASRYGYDDAAAMKEAMTAAYVLDYVLTENGLEMTHQGGLSSGSSFYMQYISGIDTSAIAVPENLQAKLEENGFTVDPEPGEEGTLGEFDITYGSGWMYSVNGVFPNVGFCDYVPQDGDVMRVQFTVAYGAEFGSSMWGPSDPWFEVVSREELTSVIADAIAARIDVSAAEEIIAAFGVTQEELDDVMYALKAELGQE